jgi:hypothetical protein
MKFNKTHTLLFILVTITCVIRLQAYEIQIEKGPALDAGPNTFLFENPSPPKENEALMSWLGGAEKIKRILIGTPYANKNQIALTKEYVQNRFEKSICINSQKDAWHYAPFTMGTIYLCNGSKINFNMYLSGISVGDNLFALKND